MPASTGLGEPRQGTHLSMLRTTHPRTPEGALPTQGALPPDSPDYLPFRPSKTPVSPDYPGVLGR